ncbi:MAG: addiction module protein [Bacteroidetes bacterium]|nr:addiction module protein [Bacteroidota bacterium]
MKTNQLEKEALRLSPKEKAVLSYKLLESIDSENFEDIDKLWQKEVEERYKQITSGSAKLKNAELVIHEAKSKYK